MPAASDGHPLSPTQASAVALRTAAIPSVVVGVVAVALGWWFKGANGALGAALGSIVAILFFAVGQYVLGRILDGHPDLALSAGRWWFIAPVFASAAHRMVPFFGVAAPCLDGDVVVVGEQRFEACALAVGEECFTGVQGAPRPVQRVPGVAAVT